MKPRIAIINPNSNERVTAGLREALAGHPAAAHCELDCRTLADGPFGIESAADIAAVEPLLVAAVQGDSGTAAFVIACYSDPGLAACRQASGGRPVLGMQQAAVLTALARGGRAGVLALSAVSIARHEAYLASLGLGHAVVAEEPLGMSVEEAADAADTADRVVAAGGRLLDAGADLLIFGCAGLAAHRGTAERALGVPVIEPVQAAVTLAAGALA